MKVCYLAIMRNTRFIFDVFWLIFLCIMNFPRLYAQCDNALQFPPGPSIAMTCGSNIVSSVQWAGDYNLTKSYPDQSLLTFASSIPTDFITIRKASDNTVLAFGITPVSLLYDLAYDSLEMHINTNSACGTENTNRETSVFVLCGCNNNFQFPANVTDIQEGENLITTSQFAGDYYLSQGYKAMAHCLFTSSVSTDFITIRKTSDNTLLASGQTPLVFTYDISFGQLETHINTGDDCGEQFVNRTTKVWHDTLEVSESFTFKGGGSDGSNSSFTEKNEIVDALLFRGGQRDGFRNVTLFQIPIQDSAAFFGGFFDGSHVASMQKSFFSDSLSQAGGVGQGFAFSTLMKYVITDVNVSLGGNADGHAIATSPRVEDFAFRGSIGQGFAQNFFIGTPLESFYYKGGGSDGYQLAAWQSLVYLDDVAFLGSGNDGSDVDDWIRIPNFEPLAFKGAQADGIAVAELSNNYIAFRGGAGDGYYQAILASIVIEDIVYQGGHNDGWCSVDFSNPVVADVVFTGGSSDGWSLSALQRQSYSEILSDLGGAGDGFHFVSKSKNLIADPITVMGGNADGFGWSLLTKRELTASIVFTGGEGRGEDSYQPGCEGNERWWNGDFDTNWHNPLNWSCHILPNANSIVVIRSGLVRYPVVSVSTEIHSLFMQNGSSCQLESNAVLKLNGE